jgi:hypothetical protein
MPAAPAPMTTTSASGLVALQAGAAAPAAEAADAATNRRRLSLGMIVEGLNFRRAPCPKPR